LKVSRIIVCAAAVSGAYFASGPASAQPETAPAPPPPAAAPAKVESIGGQRWSPSLGFVSAATLPPAAAPEDARLSVVETRPAARAPAPVRDTGTSDSGDSDSEHEESLPVGAFYFGLGSLGLAPESPERTSPSGDQLAFSESSSLEVITGLKFVFPGGERIGGWMGLALALAFGDTEVTRNGQVEKYSVFTAPISMRGGLDVHIVRYLDIGPRVGGQVGPYSLKPEADDTSSSSSGSAPSQSAFSFYYEYGAQARIKFGRFALEPALVWRNSADVSGQYLVANAMFGIGSIYLMGWWESRLSTDGRPQSSSTAEAYAAGFPEDSRIGAGIGIAMF
jgi:hypothetical protein